MKLASPCSGCIKSDVCSKKEIVELAIGELQALSSDAHDFLTCSLSCKHCYSYGLNLGGGTHARGYNGFTPPSNIVTKPV